MADISMCLNIKCPSKDTCYRFRAIPGVQQSVSSYDPGTELQCESYWSIEGYSENQLSFKTSENSNSTVDDRESRNDLNCSFCRPNRGENTKRRGKRGKGKPKYKDKK